VLYSYSRRTARNSANFLERVVEQMPFPVQRVQMNRGREFFGLVFQEKLQAYSIKFRAARPYSPHLNGKLERSQKTDLQEFYVTANLKDHQLNERLEEWQFHYNLYRSRSSLKGKTPMDVVTEKSALTPLWEEIEARYDPSIKTIWEQNYGWERKLSKYRKKGKPAEN